MKPCKINALGVFTGSCPTQTLEAPTPTNATKASEEITIVFVTGYGSTDFHTQHVPSLFELEDFRFRHVQLPSIGRVLTAAEAFADDADAVREATMSETRAGKKVVLALHSTSVGPCLKALSSTLSMNYSKDNRTCKSSTQSSSRKDARLRNSKQPRLPNDPSHINGSRAHLNNPIGVLFRDLSPYEAQAYIDTMDQQSLLSPAKTRSDVVDDSSEA